MGFATIRLEGDLQRILRLVDQEPLRVFSKHGLDPGDYFGRVSGVARLRVPLYQGAPVDEEDYTIEATIYDAAVPELISEGGLTEGTITLTVTPSGLVGNGTGLLRGAPFDFYWTQDFIPSETEAYSTRIEISGNVSDQNLHRFGLPEDLTMEGTARVYMSMRGIDGEFPVLHNGNVGAGLFQHVYDEPLIVLTILGQQDPAIEPGGFALRRHVVFGLHDRGRCRIVQHLHAIEPTGTHRDAEHASLAKLALDGDVTAEHLGQSLADTEP